MRSTLDSTEAWISSRRLSNARDISGFSEANVWEHKSVPYLCFTKFGESLCINLSHVNTTQFRGTESYPHQNREFRHDALFAARLFVRIYDCCLYIAYMYQ